MTDVAATQAARPATPSWLDARLLLGVALVLVSVVAGARLLASADRTQRVWAVVHDLPAGATLAAGDVRAERVRLFGDASLYLSATAAPPLGYVLERPVGTGELLPTRSLARPGQAVADRDVAVPVGRTHLPPGLRAGSLVDVYVTPDGHAADGAAGGPASPAPPRLVLGSLGVLSRPDDGGLSGGDTVTVVLEVPPAQVQTLLAAMAQGHVDLVQVAG